MQMSKKFIMLNFMASDYIYNTVTMFFCAILNECSNLRALKAAAKNAVWISAGARMLHSL